MLKRTLIIAALIIALCLVAAINQGIIAIYEDGSWQIIQTQIGGCFPFAICND